MRFDFVCEKEFDLDGIRHPKDVLPVLMKYKDSPQETFLCITMNANYEPIKCHICSLGIVNKSLFTPREVFREAITDNAVAVIVAHNHPSCNCRPSDSDIESTKVLIEAGNILGIPVLDHIIFAPNEDYMSFQEHGLIENV